MNNKKHAFMVPVMTLAVCAIAMVGLGFALTTSVTSSDNDVEKLMIDLDDKYEIKNNSDEVIGGINHQKAPDNTDVNSLFDYRITSTKNVTSGNTTMKYKLEYDTSYLKIFSNVSGKTATLKVKGDGISSSGTITEVVLGLYETNTNGSIGTEKAKATITGTGEATFNPVSGTYNVKAETVYIVQIDSITIEGITYLPGQTGITITQNGSTYTYSDGSSAQSKTVNGFPEFKGTYGDISFTFTAEADPKG